jgi:uncharacterized protein YodC (DUF2158 family)
MPKSFFEDTGSNGDGDKLFATEYLAANKKEIDREFTVTEVVIARSGKGYMVHTEYFICWLWKKSKLTGMLIEALNTYTKTSRGFHLFVQLTNKNKDCFVIGANTDVECRWYDLGNGSYSLTPSTSSSMESENPFLLPALSPPIGETENETIEEAIPIRKLKRA